eukprot:COSAG03_NODE_15202_length_438_cov_0.802360_2_plen_37_part_01
MCSAEILPMLWIASRKLASTPGSFDSIWLRNRAVLGY